MYADVRLDPAADFVRLAVGSSSERAAFLDRVRRSVAAG